MDSQTKNLKGAPKHDAFKLWHKQLALGSYLYACDIDLVLVDFVTKIIVAILEYKADKILTDSEILVFNYLELLNLPVFIIHCENIGHNPITIFKYCANLGHNIFDHPIVLSNATDRDYVEWERKIRGYVPLEQVIGKYIAD